jgi:CheY-like chemotaxis protein
VIVGNLELIDERVRDDSLRLLLQPALQAAEAGAAFNRRLLSLSGRHRLRIAPFAVNDRVRAFIKLIEAALGPKIALKLDLADDLWMCVADPGEVDNALLNLATNSRDALPHGGEVTIATRNVTLEEAEAREDLRAVDYVRLSVVDNGVGMTPEVLRRALEPFFSTKAEGKGVGLGLSGVHAFVERAGGFVTIESREGNGTTVSFHLPRAPAEARSSLGAGAEEEALLGDGEIVLVVEDDEPVREVTLKRVEALGYVVESARSGAEAIEILKSGPHVQVILSDIVMSDVSGHDLKEWVRSNTPAIQIVLMTGFSPEVARADSDGLDAPILLKPFTRKQLSIALADALGKTGRTTEAAPGAT